MSKGRAATGGGCPELGPTSAGVHSGGMERMKRADGVPKSTRKSNATAVKPPRSGAEPSARALTAARAALDEIERIVDSDAQESVGVLVGLLAHRNVEVRYRSAEALGILLHGRAPAELIRALEHDPDELVRTEAADSLGAIGDVRAAAALRRALGDRSRFVRAYAAAALGDLGRPSDAAILRRRLAIVRSGAGATSAFWVRCTRWAMTMRFRSCWS